MAIVNNETITLIFVIAIAVAVGLQAAILLALFIVVRKSVKKLHTEVELLRTAATPILDHTKEFVKNVSPKLDSVATDFAEMARGWRAQSVEFRASASDIMERVHRQSGRVDTMFTGALDKVDRAGNALSDAVNVPLKHLSGVAAFAKAAMASLRSNSPNSQTQRPHVADDKDLFV